MVAPQSSRCPRHHLPGVAFILMRLDLQTSTYILGSRMGGGKENSCQDAASSLYISERLHPCLPLDSPCPEQPSEYVAPPATQPLYLGSIRDA